MLEGLKTVRFAGALMLAATQAAFAAELRVCGDPVRPCAGFKEHDLSFPLPADGKARAEVRSAAFFAVILETAERCRVEELRRREIQALFPRNKVFATCFECDDDPGNNVRYTNVDAKRGFIAVYAGENRTAAGELLARAKELERFPGANLRRMQVVFVHP